MRMENSSSGDEELHVLCFSLDDNLFALPVRSIVKVTQMMAYNPVDLDVEGIVGMVNLHGKEAYLVDISTRLKLPPRELTPEKVIIFLEDSGVLSGIVADELKEIYELDREKLNRSKLSSKLISSVLLLNGEAVALLSPEAITGMVKPWI